MKITREKTGSFYNYLSVGCRLCYKGAKMVLFVTGLCKRSCFYCPVSEERRGRDIVYANERLILRDEEILEEARLMDALGTGITGGEPLLRLDRVLHYIRLLKREFGNRHHIHLYTSLVPGPEVLEALAGAGLDEIRFHPPLGEELALDSLKNALSYAKSLGILVGLEIPALRLVPELVSLVREIGGFLNINELEYADTNAEALNKKGFRLKNDNSWAAAGSEEIALEIAKDLDIKVHFCSSRFKDAVQFRERLKRIARNTSRTFDEITQDGTLVYGVIEGKGCAAIIEEIPMEMYSFLPDRIETAWWIAEEIGDIAKKAGCVVKVVERYPMINGMVVEQTPI